VDSRARLAERGPGELTVRVEVDAPLANVFAAATDWERQSDWVALTTVRVVRGDGRTPGSVVTAFTGIGRLGFLDTMEIVRFEPARRVDVLHVGRVVRGPGSFGFEEMSDGRAVMVWQEWLHLPLGGLGRLAWPLVRWASAVGLRRSLRSFARGVEERTKRELNDDERPGDR
jgi:hypothetical protein